MSKQRLRDLKNYLQNLILQIDFEVGVRSDARAAREMTCNSRKSSRRSQDDNGDTAQCVAFTVSF